MSTRILIVEDDPIIAFDLQSILEDEGHAVEAICASAAEACRHLDGVSFALLDVDLLDGKSFGLASDLAARGIPFAFVSGSSRAEVPAHLQHARFVAKPYREEAILGLLPRVEQPRAAGGGSMRPCLLGLVGAVGLA